MTLPELTDYLTAYAPSLGLTVGTNLWRFKMPETCTEPSVALIPYFASKASEPMFGEPDLALEWPRIQVLVRGAADDPAPAMALAHAVYLALAKVQAMELSGTFYHRITCQQPPYLLTWDANRRPLIVFNIEAEKDIRA